MIARKIDESVVSEMPPYAREIWFYLLRSANHRDNQTCKRGQTIRRYADIIEALKWYVGYRKCSYTSAQCENSMKLLMKAGMITKTRTTRGLLITICKYDTYQTPSNYESQNETGTRAAMEPQGRQTINKNVKKLKKKETPNLPENLDNPVFRKAWEDWKKHRTEIRKKLTPSTIKRQLKMLAEYPESAADIIGNSIRNGWQGLFPEKKGGNNSGNSTGTTRKRDFANQESNVGTTI